MAPGRENSVEIHERLARLETQVGTDLKWIKRHLETIDRKIDQMNEQFLRKSDFWKILALAMLTGGAGGSGILLLKIIVGG